MIFYGSSICSCPWNKILLAKVIYNLRIKYSHMRTQDSNRLSKLWKNSFLKLLIWLNFKEWGFQIISADTLIP